jgi:response regulator RpfG family c-di-GMP phosphodiesterase
MSAVPFAEMPAVASGWKILIVDDEPEVHQVTRLVLGSFRFESRGLEFLSAYSAAEARERMREHPDVAVILLDVVMETEHAGLDVVRTVREELGNRQVRIVLRTGQPGQAPEQDIISAYDINDYKEKTELTAQRLSTTLFSALRAYRDLMTIEASKQGLERVLRASADVFSQRDGRTFAASVLEQLPLLARESGATLLCRVEHGAGAHYRYPITMASPAHVDKVGRNAEQVLPLPRMESLHRALRKRRHIFADDHYVLHFIDSEERESLLYVGESPSLDEVDRKLIEVFSVNVSIAFENLHLNQELVDSQLEMIWLLAGAAETRSRETANHVKRVGLMSEMLGRAYGLDAKAAESLRLAAPLHDIGKIGIPDAILNKPGAHTPEEAVVMRSHARLGAQLLASSRRPLLQLASQICLEHHENWDGSGYPNGLHGEDISLEGRIVALADVFDALGSARCYKDPWSLVRIRNFIADQNGRKFDPRLVTLLFERWDEAEALRDRYPDD